MKRTNVIVDEELLEKARLVTGEKTYSGAIHTALTDYVRRSEFREILRHVQERARQEPVFDPDYLKQIRPNAYTSVKRAVAADEKRMPTKTRKRRATR